jgi:hypothetical protein
VSFRFEDALIETRKGERRALVFTPLEEFRVGAGRLTELRANPQRGEIDRRIIDRVRFSKTDYDVVIFRGKSADGKGIYRIDDRLSEGETAELTRMLVLTQLQCWRSLLALGVPLMVHSDFGSSALPFRTACRELADDPDRDSEASARVAAIDEWILRHLVFFFSQSYEATITTLLPDKLPLLELRREKLRLFAQVLREESW